jgi:hypothetical protein
MPTTIAAKITQQPFDENEAEVQPHRHTNDREF